MFIVEKTGFQLGAFISDLNLAENITDEDFENLYKALSEYEVLFFRNQNISFDNHRRFASAFGSMQTHPAYPTVEGFPEITILENDKENPSKIEEWHTDMTFKKKPPLGSILIGKIIPKTGGDTLFSSLSRAFEDLSDEWKEKLMGMNAIHSFEFGFKESLEEKGGRERLADALLENPPVTHPVIKQHPVTGKKIIYVNKLFTSHIEGDDSENTILNFLFEHIHQEKYQYRFSWENNSIAFWDNRSVLHKPVNDYWPQLRRMERITIET
jgi:taurine dioxygenase|tara:strand:- start:182 stop:988 length:807 start_codon:yes stop_codon:yes gene_type:complete